MDLVENATELCGGATNQQISLQNLRDGGPVDLLEKVSGAEE